MQAITAAPGNVPKFRNRLWENWGWSALLLSSLLTFVGLSMGILEIVRIIYGLENRGVSNYFELNRKTGVVPIKDDSLLWPIGPDNAFPERVEKFHYWPWTFAGNLFGLIAATAGVVGIISHYRRSYSSIILFMTLCLLSIGFCAYLIGYFAVLVSYYNSLNYMAAGHAQTIDTSFGIIIANLVLSIILTILAAIGALLAALALSLCRNKGLHFAKYQPYFVPNRTQGHIVPQTYL